MAPSRRAVAMACRPATPAPMTSTRAGGTVPAAVIIIGMALPKVSAPTSTALYPDRLAWLDRMSMDCARVIRGISSSENASTPAPA